MALTKTLALAYAPYGVTVNTIAPPGIETPMHHQGQAAGHMPSNEVMAQSMRLGRLGTPDDIAAAAAFLASEDAGFITGQTLGANGGQVLSRHHRHPDLNGGSIGWSKLAPYPPMNPPSGYITRIAPEKIGGVGPWRD